MATLTQNDQILAHLRQHGNISPMEAWGMFKVRSLTRRIRDLKDAGHHIVGIWKMDTTGQRYKRYVYTSEIAESRKEPTGPFAWMAR